MTTTITAARPAAWFGSARLIDAALVRESTPWGPLVAALRNVFAHGVVVPPRHHHPLGESGTSPPVLLIMPAWRPGRHLGVKLVHVAADNASRSLPGLHSLYVLSDAASGESIAIIDGGELTVRRTAAVSALGASLLARTDASRLLVVGTGRLAPHLAAAHASVRPLRSIGIWGRDSAKAARAVAVLKREHGLAATVETDLEAAVGRADVVSCATASTGPLIRGEWLAPGTHVDLVGGFTPTMRETDDAAIARAELWIDTPVALAEAGDLIGPLQSGAIAPDAIRGDLSHLCAGTRRGRNSPAAITLFKSVGSAEADLGAAELIIAALATIEPPG